MRENVVLVDEEDREIGITSKTDVHHQETSLHRGFSIYVFTPAQGKILIQRRNRSKVTWPGFWSNSCCGHPGQGESYLDAAARRVRKELGISIEAVEKMADYRYRFEYNHVAENEICPILVGLTNNEEIQPDSSEIEDAKWVSWSEYLRDMEQHGDIHSPWSREQVKILSQTPRFKEWLAKHHIELI